MGKKVSYSNECICRRIKYAATKFFQWGLFTHNCTKIISQRLSSLLPKELNFPIHGNWVLPDSNLSLFGIDIQSLQVSSPPLLSRVDLGCKNLVTLGGSSGLSAVPHSSGLFWKGAHFFSFLLVLVGIPCCCLLPGSLVLRNMRFYFQSLC